MTAGEEPLIAVLGDEDLVLAAGVADEALAGVQEIRADARALHKTSTTGDQLYRVYLIALLTLPLGYLMFGTLRERPRIADAVITTLLARGALVVPIVLLGLAISGLRLAAWTGPVVVARADLAWLFSLPLDRSRLTRPRLRRALIVAAIVGGCVGALATIPYHLVVGLAPHGAAEATRMGLAGAIGGGSFAVILACVGWLVEIHRPAARAIMRFSGLVLVLLAVLVVFALTAAVPASAVRTAVLVSGPWGWVAASVLAGASPPGVPPVAGLVAVAGLVVLALLLTRAALLRAGQVPLQELSRRAATSAQVTAAAVYFADFRSAAQARDRVVRTLVGRSRRRLPKPSRPELLVPWIGATILLRQPRRMGQALLWLIAAALLMSTGLRGMAAASGPRTLLALLVPLAAAVAYGAAGTLVEPLRVEVEQRFGLRMLPQPLELVGVVHLAVPAVAMLLLSVLAAGIGVMAGLIPTQGLALAPLIGLLAVPSLITVAGFVASGPPADSTWLYAGDAGLGRLALHLLRGPLLAAITVGVPILLSGDAAADPAQLPGGVLSCALWTAATVVGLGRWVQTRLLANH